MTIYILHDDFKKIAEYLDDKSLDRMIKDISQVLCNVHHRLGMNWLSTLNVDCKWEDTQKYHNIPLKKTFLEAPGAWADWARECVANYMYLVALGIKLCGEYTYRFSCDLCYSRFEPCFVLRGGGSNHNKLEMKFHKMEKVIEWNKDNVPDLPSMYEYIEGYGGWDQKHEITLLPLVMPKKYILKCLHCQRSYRNYYRAKITIPCDVDIETLKKYSDECGGHHLKDNVKWTKREKPYFIGE